MDEFAKMIYEQWNKEHDERDLFFDKGSELKDKLETILSRDLCEEIYDKFCESSQQTEERAFIEGFAYACNCLSRGRITFGKAQDN
ncbi:hypothetical protein LI187_10885 [bacterium 210820-DFI.6.38]|nr:hypothetical protein [bacterium 210820-DFI.6.38]